MHWIVVSSTPSSLRFVATTQTKGNPIGRAADLWRCARVSDFLEEYSVEEFMQRSGLILF